MLVLMMRLALAGQPPPSTAGDPAAEADPGASSSAASSPSAPATADRSVATPPAMCRPTCREGFVCVEGQCVSACNPPCEFGQVCTGSGQCEIVGGDAPAAPPPASASSTRSRRAVKAEGTRKGPSLAVGSEFDYARAIYRVDLDGRVDSRTGAYAAHGALVSLSTVFQYDHGITDRFFLGGRFGLGGILNSDNSTGTRLRVQFGPSMTGFVTKNFYIGTDVLFEYLSFDDISPKFPKVESFDAAGSEDVADMDAKKLLGLTWALRFGGTIPINDRFAIAPELRLRGNFKYFDREGVDVDHLAADGTCCVTDEPSKIYTPAIGFAVSARWFF